VTTSLKCSDNLLMIEYSRLRKCSHS